MRDYNIVIEPFKIMNLLECTIDKKVNEHFTAKVSGYLSESAIIEEIQSKANSEVCIKFKNEKGTEQVVFQGIVEDIEICVEGLVKRLTFSATSKSKLLDLRRHTRTFQNINQTYQTVLDFIAQQNPGMLFVFSNGSEPTGGIEIQYHETDWEFIKRLASQLNTVVVSDNINKNICVSFGVPKRSGGDVIKTPSFRIEKVVEEFMYNEANELSGFGEYDANMWVVEERSYYNICSPVSLNGTSLFVYRALSYLEGGEFIHRYYLRTKSGFRVSSFQNQRMIGAALDGHIIGVQGDVVQVHVSADPECPTIPKWFPYSTVYSSPDGSGWYCMPEIGDCVRLYFPDEFDNHAYVISSVHEKNANQKRCNPNWKSLSTVYGKEIELTEHSITLTNHNGMSICLDDKTGIIIESDKNIELKSDADIMITSDMKVDIQGTLGVDVQQNNNNIKIGNDIHQTAVGVYSK